MPLILVTIGIPGSGKSRLFYHLMNVKRADMCVISPDNIRRDLWGDVNEQKEGNRVFERAKNEIRAALDNYDIIGFDATNLSMARNNEFLEEFDCKKLFIFMQDSLDADLCKIRVNSDIENGKDRSKVPEALIDKMHERYKSALMNSMKNKYENCFLYHDNFSTLVDYIDELTNY